MRSFLLGFVGATCALAIVGSFFVGKLYGRVTAGEPVDPASSWRLSLAYEGEREGQALREPLALADAERSRVATPSEEEPEVVSRAARAVAGRAPAATPERRAPRGDLAYFDRRKLHDRRDSLDGELLEAWHSKDQRAFRGTQVRAADGAWVREGEWEAWHENGTLHELGAYRAGEEHGPWTWWYDSGRMMAQGEFVEGLRVGDWSFWYPSGARQMEGAYVDGVGEGVWTHWFEDGELKATGELRAGEPHGPWRVFHENGSVDRERTGTYASGERVD